MREKIIRDVSDSMLGDIRSLSSQYESKNVGFANTMKKVRQMDTATIKRTLAGAATAVFSAVSVGSFIEAGVATLNNESIATDNVVLLAAMSLATTFGVVYDRLTESEKNKLPAEFKDFKNADKMDDKQLMSLIKSKTAEEYKTMTDLMKSFRSSPSYDGDSPVLKTPSMKM